MNMPSIPAQSTTVSQSQFHGGPEGESASAAQIKFDRWTISLGAIDSFLRGKGREAAENIAERMCRRAEHQQGTKSFNLSNLKQDLGACGLPVDGSQGRSKEQKVKIVTGLILRLQTEANSGIADRPLGHSFCALMKKSESSIAEGMQQLLDEVNGHFAEEPMATAKETPHAADGTSVTEYNGSPGFSGLTAGQSESIYPSARLPSSSFAAADPAATPLAPPPSYDDYSSDTETKLAHLSAHIERLMGDRWGDEHTDYRHQMQWIKAELAHLEPLGCKHFSGKFTEVRKQFEELQVEDFHHRLDKLEEANIGSSRDIQSVERNLAQLSKCFGELALVDEECSRLVERQEALSSQLGEIKTFFGILNNIQALTTDLHDCKYRELTDHNQIVGFFNHIEDGLNEISVSIDSQPAGSQRTELLEKESQLRDLLNTNKKTIKHQQLDHIERLIKTQENNNERGTTLNKDRLEQTDDQLHDLKVLMTRLTMDEQEGGMLEDLKGRQAKLNLILHGEDGQARVSQAKSSNSGSAGEANESLDNAENLIATSESDPYGFDEQRALEAKRHLDEAIAQCKTLRNKAQRSELLDRHRSLGTRLQKIECQKGEIVQKKVRELLNRAHIAMDFFPDYPSREEVKEVDALFEQARLELRELSGNNDDIMRAGLLTQFNKLKEKLRPYKKDLGDGQQTAAASSEVKDQADPLKKEFDDYWKEYGRKSKDLEEQVLKCSESDHPREQRVGKLEDLKKFYENSLEAAGKLRLEKFAGKPDYDNECQILVSNMDHMRTQIKALERQINRLKQEEPPQEQRGKRSGCKQS